MLIAAPIQSALARKSVETYRLFSRPLPTDPAESFWSVIERAHAAEPREPAAPSPVRREFDPPVLATAVNTTPADAPRPQATGRVFARGVKVVAGSTGRTTSASLTTGSSTNDMPVSHGRAPTIQFEPPAAPPGQYLDVFA